MRILESKGNCKIEGHTLTVGHGTQTDYMQLAGVVGVPPLRAEVWHHFYVVFHTCSRLIITGSFFGALVLEDFVASGA